MSQNVISMWEGSLDSVEYSSKNMDHLGIVVWVCKEIDLAGEIDRMVGVAPESNLRSGCCCHGLEYSGLRRQTFISVPWQCKNKGTVIPHHLLFHAKSRQKEEYGG